MLLQRTLFSTRQKLPLHLSSPAQDAGPSQRDTDQSRLNVRRHQSGRGAGQSVPVRRSGQLSTLFLGTTVSYSLLGGLVYLGRICSGASSRP